MFRKALVPLAGILLSAAAPALAHDGDWDDRRPDRRDFFHERLEAEHDAARAYRSYLTPWELRRLHRQLRREHRYYHWLSRHRAPCYR